MPSDYLKRQLWELDKNMSYGQEIATASRKRIAQYEDNAKSTIAVEDYAVQKTADSLARSALFALDQEKTKKLKEPIVVSPEMIFPEQYGSHPDELRRVVKESRDRMIELMTQPEVKRGYKYDPEKKEFTEQQVKNPLYSKYKSVSEAEAKKLAGEHIKATIDIGHINTWRKYFAGSDEEFREWIATKIQNMAKEGMVGLVHISDNFGWEDEHVSPGEGTAPIAGFLKEIRKAGYVGPIIVEPGAQESQIDALKAAMRSFNSPIYRIDGASVSWADVEHSYFGRVRSPTYVVGAYAPDVDLPTEHRTWTLWSGVPLE